MKLYDSPFAPSPRRVRIYLAEKGIEVERVTIDIRYDQHLDPAYLAINPRGVLPTLQLDDGETIDESAAICRYFEALFPGPSLFGITPIEIARIERWARYIESDGYAATVYAFRNGHPVFKDRATAGYWPPMPQIPELVQRARTMWERFTRTLDAALAGSAWIAGPAFSYADIVGLTTIDFARPGRLAVPEDCANLRRWHEAASARPSAAA